MDKRAHPFRGILPRLHGLAALIAVMLATSACLAQQREPSLEEQAQEVAQSLMCPVCPGETVDQSQVALAKQMRAIIYEKLAAGEPRQQILDFFIARYGVGVLAAPPRKGFNLLAWVMPIIGVAAGGGAVLLALRAMRRRAPSGDTPMMGRPPGDEELAPYLARVDEEMRQVLQETSPPEQSGAGAS